MLYWLLKLPARCCLWIYCRCLRINKKEFLRHDGPLIIASNHPNSFLDAIILSTIFKKPVHSLARGDAFKNKFIAWLLRSIHMLPVYRTSEGVENLEHNYTTFDACKEIFRKNGVVLIFSEGRCINEWHLRPLKKGTARLVISSWEDGIDLKVLPCGLNYQSFTSFGKNLELLFGNIISKKDIVLSEGYGRSINSFNHKLWNELEPLVPEIEKSNEQEIKKKFAIPVSSIKKILLAIPAAAGYILHFPLFYPVQKFAYKKGGHIDHYDSLMVGILFLLYPFYLLLIAIGVSLFTCGYWWLLTFAVLPFCARSFVQVKKQF
ncbi:1-acyl-sn-glycerol-3-phosphate acyltransferase [Ferruginibacter sp. HRS2-29]|uniref:1-acyl-sn-glycerol-3-phosphate acyltransferase n=1 Tax=Ferruginibacter sp. HRS2-29 TaxID=2487334 RepID=UPI0020CDFA00|nr:1-acyl-sn-glycerol-3-phosphate acyltransferase [Ferruginibacter sp. HRS2-29]MCP9752517.1 glycerol acyltransferase [Ferruginibacter sp. HRS2-29]